MIRNMFALLLIAGAATEVHAATGGALIGEPYGVAEVIIEAGPDAENDFRSAAYSITEANGRILAPVFSSARLLNRGILTVNNEQMQGDIKVMFLFRGEQPLELSVQTGRIEAVRLNPKTSQRRQYRRMLQRWWREYHNAMEAASQAGDSPVVYQYTTNLLARRLNLEPPLLRRITATSNSEITMQTLQLLGGMEHYRSELRAETLAGRSDRAEAADQPLPAPIEWLEPSWIDAPGVAVEPLAMHVPQNCFYIRFGTFVNYLWFTQLLEDYGGDLATMVTPRSIERSVSEQVQGRLGLKQSALAEVVGPTVIADVALIGHDLYTLDGAAMGILFQARNNAILGNDLATQRHKAAQRMKDQGATEETLEIQGHKVSYVGTPDHRLRSFYVTDGDFHFVTTSRTLVEEFLRAGASGEALGATAEFKEARTRMPLDRDDTIFAYFSTHFFQHLVAPHYQIELKRRLRAATDIELLILASLAARGERVEASSTDELIDGGFLPPSFSSRPEGGHLELNDGQIVDTLRGARGAFMPISDMEVPSITRTEAEAYAERAEYLATWGRFDPLMVGIRRFALDDKGRERLAMEAHIAPLDETKYGWLLSILGPATNERIAPVPGDIISAQAFVQGGLLDPAVPPHHLFLGVQDSPANLQASGLFEVLQMVRSTPGYLGGWPKPGFLDWLPPFLGGGEPDPDGYSRLPLGLWRRQFADFSILSFDRGVLEHVTQTLTVEPAPPAQFRLYVGDISQSQLQGLINDLAAERALRSSYGNIRFVHTLAEQLHVSREDALEDAERLVNGKLVCPLGGEYKFKQPDDSDGSWLSTAWNENSEPPANYQAPVLSWFRGLNTDLTRTEDGVILRAELDLQRLEREQPALEIPLFNLFKGTRPSAAPQAKEEKKAPQRF